MVRISRKSKAISDGIFRVEVYEFLKNLLNECGFSGLTVRITPVRTFIIMKVTRPRDVLGEEGRNLREIASLVRKRFGFEQNQLEILAERIRNRSLCASTQVESLRFKIMKGVAPRRSCYSVIRNVMEAGAIGCEIAISGKLRAQRAKTMKFRDGYLISNGDPSKHYLLQSIRTVCTKQGVLGLRVRIMLPHDPSGIDGCPIPLPDKVTVRPPKNAKQYSSQIEIVEFMTSAPPAKPRTVI